MLFDSLKFALFFAVVLGLTAAVRRRVSTRNGLLLAASYLFYACWDWRFLGLIWVSTAVDYLCGMGLDVRPKTIGANQPRSRRDRLLLGVSLAANLGILAFFKYAGFFADSAAAALHAFGWQLRPWTLHVVLPVGISFYTFQTLSYTIDVYRRRLPAERNLLTFALYVAFFPQLVAGPIERATRLLPQLRQERPMRFSDLSLGTYLIAQGLIKKLLFADNIAWVVDHVFACPSPTGIDVLIGMYAFAIQIYCDFSGYSDIARGTARCLGFELMVNFDWPYAATNPREFWRRWHISLSTWLRDYLYIPLGGSRRGRARTVAALLVTMLLGGLWHGAAWTFVVWGLYHGLLLAAHRALTPRLTRVTQACGRRMQPLWRLGCWAAMLFLICLGWLFFRAPDLTQAWHMLGALTSLAGGLSVAATTTRMLVIFTLCLGAFGAWELAQVRWHDPFVLLRLPAAPRAVAYAAVFIVCLILGEFDGNAFIYFQF